MADQNNSKANTSVNTEGAEAAGGADAPMEAGDTPTGPIQTSDISPKAQAWFSYQLKAMATALQNQIANIYENKIRKLERTIGSLRKEMLELSLSTSNDVSALVRSIKELATTMTQINVSGYKGPNITFPEFDGSIDCSFERWVRDLEICFDYLGWAPNHPKRRTIIPTLLKSFARAQYETITNVGSLNYTELMTELHKLFAHVNKPINVRYQHTLRKQEGEETVRDYSADMMQRIKDCNMKSEELKVMTYLNGLLPQIKIEIAKMEFNTLQQVITCAERAENVIRIQNQLSDEITASSSRKSRENYKEKRDENMKESSSHNHRSISKHKSRSRKRARSHSRECSSRKNGGNNKMKRSNSTASIKDISDDEQENLN